MTTAIVRGEKGRFGELKKYTAFDITLTHQFIQEHREEAARHPEVDYADIRIKIDGGKEHAFTLEEFSKRIEAE